MRNKQRLLIMFLLIVMLFLYIVNNGHGLLYNHVIALEDEISFVAALIVLILSIPKAVDTFAKQSKIVKSISFISKVLALLIILMIPYLKDFVLLKKLMSVLDTNILLILILFFAYAGQFFLLLVSTRNIGKGCLTLFIGNALNFSLSKAHCFAVATHTIRQLSHKVYPEYY